MKIASPESLTDLDPAAPIWPRSADCPIPLANAQRRTWKQSQRSFGALAAATQVLGPLDPDLLLASLHAVQQRHESLRTRIAVVDSQPRQLVDPDPKLYFNQVDLSDETELREPTAVRDSVEEFVAESIDIATGPVFRASVWRLSADHHVFAFALDHLVSDAASIAILGQEIWTLYRQAAAGLPFSLSPLLVQFGDYAVWQQRTDSRWLAQHGSYWLGRLANTTRPRIAVDFGSLASTHRTDGVLHVPFGKKLSVALQDLAGREQLRLPVVVLSAYVCAMSLWCQQRDLLVAFVSHGRHRPELAGMIGNLASLLYFRIEITDGQSFRDLLEQAQGEFDRAFAHYDFDRVPDLVPDCATDVGFNWVANTFDSIPHVAHPADVIRLRTFPFRMSWSLGMIFFCSDTPAGIAATMLYRSDLFAAGTLERFGRRMRTVARQMAEQPETNVASTLAHLASS